MQVASQVGFLACFYKAIGDTVELLFCDTIEKTLKVTQKKTKKKKEKGMLAFVVH